MGRMTYKDGKLIEIKDLEQCLEDIKNIVDDKDKLIDNLKKQIDELKEENYKDGKLQEMEERITKMRNDCNRGFPITEKEAEDIEKWKTKHIKKKHWDKDNNCPTYIGAIGGRFVYQFIPTSIGIIGEIQCECGEKHCFQNID